MIGNIMAPSGRRQKRGLAAASAALAALAGLAGAAAATTEYVVVDRHSGLAIGGYDAMAYFIDGAPSLGKAAFELRHAGAVWRFRNDGNRAAFASHPEVYAPRFGGYDVTGIARGVALAGDPRFWAMADQRLYLFYTPQNRSAFVADMADMSQIIAAANKRWPVVQLSLSP
jgi:hypothetical protein